MSVRVQQLAVVMERRVLANRWQDEAWQAIGVLPDAGEGASPRLLRQDAERSQWLHQGLALSLHRDEAENYYLNLSAPQPCVFVVWRSEGAMAVPCFVTLSYGEAARFMDAGEQVDSVAMSEELRAWLAEFVQQHYRPEPKKRSRPPSFNGARRA